MIPLEMQRVAQWLLFKLTTLPNGKITKDPRQAKHPSRHASKTDPSTWCDYETACAAQARLGCGWALGFALANGFVGLDGDGVRHPQSGETDPTTLSYLQLLNTFTESSISGTGVHAIATGGPLPPDGRKKKPFELYDQHMFVVTGELLVGFPATVEHRPDEIAELHKRIFGGTPNPNDESLNSVFGPADLPRSVAHLSDDELLALARTASNGEKFTRLFDGDTSAYGGDASAADMALCSMLAFWTQCESERMDRLFRRSGLIRDKWTDRPDYRNRTISRAIARATEVYQPLMEATDDEPDQVEDIVDDLQIEDVVDDEPSIRELP